MAAIERLWDDPAFEARHRGLAKAEARRWDIERVARQYADFLNRSDSGLHPRVYRQISNPLRTTVRRPSHVGH